jgi:hypothetical protein
MLDATWSGAITTTRLDASQDKGRTVDICTVKDLCRALFVARRAMDLFHAVLGTTHGEKRSLTARLRRQPVELWRLCRAPGRTANETKIRKNPNTGRGPPPAGHHRAGDAAPTPAGLRRAEDAAGYPPRRSWLLPRRGRRRASTVTTVFPKKTRCISYVCKTRISHIW